MVVVLLRRASSGVAIYGRRSIAVLRRAGSSPGRAVGARSRARRRPPHRRHAHGRDPLSGRHIIPQHSDSAYSGNIDDGPGSNDAISGDSTSEAHRGAEAGGATSPGRAAGANGKSASDSFTGSRAGGNARVPSWHEGTDRKHQRSGRQYPIRTGSERQDLEDPGRRSLHRDSRAGARGRRSGLATSPRWSGNHRLDASWRDCARRCSGIESACDHDRAPTTASCGRGRRHAQSDRPALRRHS